MGIDCSWKTVSGKEIDYYICDKTALWELFHFLIFRHPQEHEDGFCEIEMNYNDAILYMGMNRYIDLENTENDLIDAKIYLFRAIKFLFEQKEFDFRKESLIIEFNW